MKKRRPRSRRPRTCDICREPYFRRNLVEGWDKQNPGRRAGWNKTQIRICTKCMSAQQADNMLTVASVKLVGKKRR